MNWKLKLFISNIFKLFILILIKLEIFLYFDNIVYKNE